MILEWILVLAVAGLGLWLLKWNWLTGFGILSFFVLWFPMIVLPVPDLINEHRLYGAFAGGGSFPGSCAAALSDSAGIAGASIKTVLGFLAPRFIKKFAV